MSYFRLIIFCFLALCSTICFAQDFQLPDLGQSSGTFITPTQEKKLGKIFLKKIKQKYTIIEDPIVVDYIQSLGMRLVENSASATKTFSFFIIDNPEINAFAGPDGSIGVNTGLIFATETEGELAAVIAHEIAHISQRHLVRKLETGGFISLTNAGIILASVAVNFLVDQNAGKAAMIGGQAALIQKKLAYSRKFEKEADRVGIEILAKANYDPRSLPAIFKKMARKRNSYGSKLPEILLTHPVDDARIADAISRTENFPYIQQKNELRYQILLSYLKQKKQSNSISALKLINEQLNEGKYRNKSAKEYQKALALKDIDRLKDARNLLNKLISEHPYLTEFVVTKALIDSQDNKTEKAITSLENAILSSPTSYSLNLTLAEIAISKQKYAIALNKLESYKQLRYKDPKIFRLISKAQSGLGNLFEAYVNSAESYFLSGDTEKAIQQLEYALMKFDSNFHSLSKAESNLQTYKKHRESKK